LKNLTDWKDLYSDASKNLVSWERTTDEGFKSMKAEIIIEAEMEDILRVINDNPKYRKTYDPGFFGGHNIHRINEHLVLAFNQTKKISFICGREFVLFIYWQVDSDGKVYILCFSDPDSESFVERNPDLVRARLILGGWVLEKVGQDRVKITYFIEMDYAGNVPNFLLTVSFKDQAQKLPRLQELTRKVKEERLSG
jgi:START domain